MSGRRSQNASTHSSGTVVLTLTKRWPNVGVQSDADLKAIFAYLRSIPAIRNDVPAPKVPDEVMNGIAASYDKLLAKMKGQAAAAAPAATQAVAQR